MRFKQKKFDIFFSPNHRLREIVEPKNFGFRFQTQTQIKKKIFFFQTIVLGRKLNPKNSGFDFIPNTKKFSDQNQKNLKTKGFDSKIMGPEGL